MRTSGNRVTDHTRRSRLRMTQATNVLSKYANRAGLRHPGFLSDSGATWPKTLNLLAKPSHRAFGRRQRRSEEHTSELQSLMRISYAVFCLKKKTTTTKK